VNAILAGFVGSGSDHTATTETTDNDRLTDKIGIV
jgi:hypothetical protein